MEQRGRLQRLQLTALHSSPSSPSSFSSSTPLLLRLDFFHLLILLVLHLLPHLCACSSSCSSPSLSSYLPPSSSPPSSSPSSFIRLEKEYTTIKNKEMEEQIEIKVRVEDGSHVADTFARSQTINVCVRVRVRDTRCAFFLSEAAYWKPAAEAEDRDLGEGETWVWFPGPRMEVSPNTHTVTQSLAVADWGRTEGTVSCSPRRVVSSSWSMFSFSESLVAPLVFSQRFCHRSLHAVVLPPPLSPVSLLHFTEVFPSRLFHHLSLSLALCVSSPALSFLPLAAL